MKPGLGNQIAFNTIRKKILPLENDRIIYKDIENVKTFLIENILLNEVTKKIKLQ
jgi:histidine ammonia-lyase